MLLVALLRADEASDDPSSGFARSIGTWSILSADTATVIPLIFSLAILQYIISGLLWIHPLNAGWDSVAAIWSSETYP